MPHWIPFSMKRLKYYTVSVIINHHITVAVLYAYVESNNQIQSSLFISF